MTVAERLSFYATKFDAVEVDSTYCGTPALSTAGLAQDDTSQTPW